jgi:two-component system sensor histidine kinase TorS
MATVLIVDDQELNRRLFADFMDVVGHAWREAGTLDAAIEVLTGDGADLVLMDLDLGTESGFEGVRRIRALPDARLAGVPVVAVTGYGGDADRRRCLDAGFNGFCAKPVSLRSLAQVIGELLADRAS